MKHTMSSSRPVAVVLYPKQKAKASRGNLAIFKNLPRESEELGLVNFLQIITRFNKGTIKTM